MCDLRVRLESLPESRRRATYCEDPYGTLACTAANLQVSVQLFVAFPHCINAALVNNNDGGDRLIRSETTPATRFRAPGSAQTHTSQRTRCHY